MSIPGQSVGCEIVVRFDNIIQHWLYYKDHSGSADQLKARITVWNESVVGPAAVKKKLKSTFLKGKPLPRRGSGHPELATGYQGRRRRGDERRAEAARPAHLRLRPQ